MCRRWKQRPYSCIQIPQARTDILVLYLCISRQLQYLRLQVSGDLESRTIHVVNDSYGETAAISPHVDSVLGILEFDMFRIQVLVIRYDFAFLIQFSTIIYVITIYDRGAVRIVFCVLQLIYLFQQRHARKHLIVFAFSIDNYSVAFHDGFYRIGYDVLLNQLVNALCHRRCSATYNIQNVAGKIITR